MQQRKPNIVFVFADQWRQQATEYAGNPTVQTPNLRKLADQSINFTRALSGCPVCSPYRASLLTGQRPLTHGVFVNDVCLRPPRGMTLAEAFSSRGYDTAYIGKWHLDGQGRSACIPPRRRLGFDYWKVLECTHDYNHSAYYDGNATTPSLWDGYDADAQTRDAETYIRRHQQDRPFLLVLSWGPPHDPYETAPDEFKALYNLDQIELRPNVPPELADAAREKLAGYYAHCSALDACVGRLWNTIRERGIADETIFIFTSDHGDMLGSQGCWNKQVPWDESIRVPFLLWSPGMRDWRPREVLAPIDAPDIMPTLLGLSGLAIPDSVEGTDYSPLIRGEDEVFDEAALLQCPHPFGQWNALKQSGREYRGLRTMRHTYVRDLRGPWLLFDNEQDPFQQYNLIGKGDSQELVKTLDTRLQEKLHEQGDDFLPGTDYIAKWGYSVNETGSVPYQR